MERPMGVMLRDVKTREFVFDVNFWHWRTIVEAVRSLKVIPDARVDGLHQQWTGTGLSLEEARAVGGAIRTKLLPQFVDGERLLLDGSRTAEPDDGTFYRDRAELQRNYSTTRQVLERFVSCCETCNGFDVN
jgi:hypothetical protein